MTTEYEDEIEEEEEEESYSFEDFAKHLRNPKKKAEAVLNIAKQLESMYNFRAIEKSADIYCYNVEKGIYENNGEIVIQKELQRFIPTITRDAVKEILEKVRMRNYKSRDDFDNNPNMLHFNNCWYCLVCGETFPHSPDRLSISKIPINYNPKAKCPTILKFMGKVLKPQDVFHMIQIAGYILYPSNRFEKVHAFLGTGSNGKGKMAEILTAMVGEQNISAQPLGNLAKDVKSCAKLYGKMLNIDHDTSEKIDLSETSYLKKLVSGNPFEVREMYKDFFMLKNRAKIIVLTNSPPQFNTTSNYADQRRLDLVTFDRTIGDDERDVHLGDKLTSAEEISGFINLALVGLRYLLKEGWARSMSIKEMQEKFDNFGNTVKSFFDKDCKINRKECIPPLELYEDYRAYCKENGKTPESFNVFGGEITKLGIDKRSRTIKGIRTNVYVGIESLRRTKQKTEIQSALSA